MKKTSKSKDPQDPEKLWQSLKPWYERFSGLLIGVDEVGRGSLAGAVVASAVVLNASSFPHELRDSKKLSEKQRVFLSQAIFEHAVAVAICAVEVSRIDEINIAQAIFEAMASAVHQIEAKNPLPYKGIFVDGNKVIPKLSHISQHALIGGDNRCPSIMAASIVAKVYRDSLMITLDAEYPGYGLGKHKGYGTKEHIEAIYRLGPSQIHRKSFEPVKSYGAS